MRRLGIAISAAVALAVIPACGGGGGGGYYYENTSYYNCHHCSKQLAWENNEIQWDCPGCGGANIRVNCYHCGTGHMVAGWGNYTCTSCGKVAGCAVCGNCGKAKRTDGVNKYGTCQHCGGR